MMQRRRLSGLVLLLVGIVLVLLAMRLHMRTLSYIAAAILAVGVVVMARRNDAQ